MHYVAIPYSGQPHIFWWCSFVVCHKKCSLLLSPSIAKRLAAVLWSSFTFLLSRQHATVPSHGVSPRDLATTCGFIHCGQYRWKCIAMFCKPLAEEASISGFFWESEQTDSGARSAIYGNCESVLNRERVNKVNIYPKQATWRNDQLHSRKLHHQMALYTVSDSLQFSLSPVNT